MATNELHKGGSTVKGYYDDAGPDLGKNTSKKMELSMRIEI